MPASLVTRTRPKKTICILQSHYAPWKDYFDLMQLADELVPYDDVQYTRRDWRNGSRQTSPSEVRWLTIPVAVKGRYLQRITETTVSEPDWAARHWSTLDTWYGKAPFCERYRPVLEEFYAATHDQLRDLLGISTPFSWSSGYPASGEKTERLLFICRAAGADAIAGPTARAYLDEASFRAEGIEVAWMSYADYPTCPQLYPPFEHGISVLDLLFSVGDDAPQYMLGAT
jgi:hypothetical protein